MIARWTLLLKDRIAYISLNGYLKEINIRYPDLSVLFWSVIGEKWTGIIIELSLFRYKYNQIDKPAF